MDSIDHVMSDDGCLDACGGLRIARGLRMSMKSMKQWSEEEERERESGEHDATDDGIGQQKTQSDKTRQRGV